ncbi:MAG: tRNA preQ1(34) S-adenosylmethionine ribosyltransferase-isomerase QueA [Parcubacteria group bacterium]
MKLKLFDYDLPKELIAQTPAVPRDRSRLLVYNHVGRSFPDRRNFPGHHSICDGGNEGGNEGRAKTKKIVHDRFYNLPKYLTNNDVLVFNNTKVFPARLLGNKLSGGKAEVLLLKKIERDGRQAGRLVDRSFNEGRSSKCEGWESMVGCTRPKAGLKLRFAHGLQAEVINQLSEKTWLIKFNFKGDKFNAILNQIGQTPLPPYIASKNQENKKSKQQNSKIQNQYQTVYAKTVGSAAAPTAGLHFTKNLLNKIKKQGCEIEFVTLHVGLGTFNPVNTENIENYKIHSEWASVDKATIKRLINAKRKGKRIIAVGTTSTRVLETVFNSATLLRSIEATKETSTGTSMIRSMAVKDFNNNISTFIYPGYKFNFVDAMITNFHLPRSSLLMLVSAFIGRTNAMKIYQTAIKMKYRFFSFGDAMLLTKK